MTDEDTDRLAIPLDPEDALRALMQVRPDAEPVTTTLPGAEIAFVSEDKLRGYLLNPRHEDGKHKLRVFESVFGYGPDRWEEFGAVLVEAVKDARVDDVRRRDDCTVYGVRVTLRDLNGQPREVVTSWKVPHAGGAPALVTAYLVAAGPRPAP